MNIYFDCEFNGFMGELISIAMVHEDGDSFYGVQEIDEPYIDWVAENVDPVRGETPTLSADELRWHVLEFINRQKLAVEQRQS